MEATKYRSNAQGVSPRDLVAVGAVTVGLCMFFRPFAYSSPTKATACISNIKQLTVANLLYSYDVDEKFCPVSDAASGRSWVELTSKYYNKAQILVCPNDHDDSISYGVNALAFFDPTTAQVAPPSIFPAMTAYKHPQETVFLCEAGAEDNLLTPRRDTYKVLPPDDHIAMSYEARPILRHYPRCALSYMDGHAKSLPAEQFYTGHKPLDYWWCADRDDRVTCQSPITSSRY